MKRWERDILIAKKRRVLEADGIDVNVNQAVDLVRKARGNMDLVLRDLADAVGELVIASRKNIRPETKQGLMGLVRTIESSHRPMSKVLYIMSQFHREVKPYTKMR